MNTADCSQSAPPVPDAFDTFADLLEAVAQRFGDCEAFVDSGERLTYAEWRAAADKLAASLAARGVRPGDIVAIMLPSSIDYAVCFGAAMLLGAIATGVNTRLGPQEISGIIRRCKPKIVITEDATKLPEVAQSAIEVLLRSELHAACSGRELGSSRPQRRPQDPAVIVWTSGTTGAPKGAWFDHRNLYANVWVAGVQTRPFDRRLMPVPFAHAGFMIKVWEQAAFVVTNVIAPPRCPAEQMLRIIVDEKVTCAPGVPTQWARFLMLPGLAQMRFPHLRICVTSAAPAPPEMVEALMRRLGCPVISRYAMTEAAGLTGTEPGDDPSILFRTVGRPQHRVELTLFDEQNRPAPHGAVGRIRVRSPCVMRGYWNEPELTASVLSPDGWFTSGDLGYLDGSGNLVLVGRATDMYIRGGYNVYPLEVENALIEHPSVAEAAVVGVPDTVIGECGVAFVVPSDPRSPPDLDTLRGWVRASLADYKAPDRLEIVAELPLTPMSKIDKSALRAAVIPAR